MKFLLFFFLKTKQNKIKVCFYSQNFNILRISVNWDICSVPQVSVYGHKQHHTNVFCGDVFQVQEVNQAFQVLLDYRENQESKEIVGCLVFLDSLMVIPQ